MDFLLPTITGGNGDGDIKFDGEMLGGDLTEIEKQFAAVLLQLPRLIFESDSLFLWGAGNKKKRTTRSRRRRDLRKGDTKKDPVTSDVSAATPTGDEPTTSKQWPEGFSPDTPLISFSPARSDPKSLTGRKTVKKGREDCILLITQLEKERDSLKRQIEDFKRKRKEAMVANALLKRQREELILAQESEKVAKLGEVNTDLTLGRQWSPPPSTVLSSSSTAAQSASYFQSRGARTDQRQPLILNRTDIVADNGISFSLEVKVNVGSTGLPDLNDPQPSDSDLLDMKAMATLARRRRRHIQKDQNSKHSSMASRRI